MVHLNLLFAILDIFAVAVSLPVEEKTEPIDMAFSCIKAETSEDKSPILLIHGAGGSQKIYNGFNSLLANQTKRNVYTVDLRNHGESPWSNSSDVEALTVDIGHFLDIQGISKINIIGQSLGGKTAIHYTLNNPERVDSIIVEDIRPNTFPPEATLQIAFMFKLLNRAIKSIPEGLTEDEARKSILDFMNKKLEQMGSKERLPDQFAKFLEIKLVDGEWNFKSNLEVLADIVKDPERFWTPSTGLYEGPTLFIYGTKSPFKVNEDKENILKLFPNAQLIPIEGAGHFVHGPEYEDIVIKFLNKIS